MEDEITYTQKHPPRCLRNHMVAPNENLKWFLLDQLGDNSTSFSTLCDCGNSKFNISMPVEFGETRTTCSSCKEVRTLFDPTKYGYDGELGHYEGEELGETENYVCPNCGNSIFEIAVAFQYAGETDILEEDDAPAINPEDLFGWVSVAAKCSKCENIGQVTESECA